MHYKLVLVNCITNLNGINKEGLPSQNLSKTKEILENYLRQALINPFFKVVSPLDLTLDNNIFKLNYAPTGNIQSSDDMFYYVKGLLTTE